MGCSVCGKALSSTQYRLHGMCKQHQKAATRVSECCLAKVLVEGRTTKYYRCTKCGWACNTVGAPQEKT